MSVELKHIEVAHHQGANKELVVGEGVNVLVVVGEVLGCLQDLEQADRHQSTVESVLCPSEVVTMYEHNPQRNLQTRSTNLLLSSPTRLKVER